MTRINGRTKVAQPRASRAHRHRGVDSAASAAAWLDVNSPPDLVPTDIVMPGHRDGLDLARHVRQRYPRLPVMVMTGYSDRMEQLATLQVVVLAKPFAPSALLAASASLGIGTSAN